MLLFAGCQNIAAQQEEKGTTTIILVRHAEKASDGSKDPPLTALGKGRAQALAKLFSSSPVEAVFSTNYTRTLETARPPNRTSWKYSCMKPIKKPLAEGAEKGISRQNHSSGGAFQHHSGRRKPAAG